MYINENGLSFLNFRCLRMSQISIVIPTYNERENLPILIDEIFTTIKDCKDINLEIIVVDDNSPDGTGAVAEELAKKYPLKVIHRKGKLGLGSAVMEGFCCSQREYLGVMDADLSHNPIILSKMIHSLKDFDIVIGSRFNEGSSVENWRIDRKIISKVGVWLAGNLTKVSDPLSGYFVLKRGVLNDMKLTSPGYKILLEILVKGRYKKIREIPFRFRTREHNVSKLDNREYMLFLKQLIKFYWMKKKKGGDF